MSQERTQPYNFWQKTILKLFPRALEIVSRKNQEIYMLIHEELQPWHDYPQYLAKYERKDYQSKIKTNNRKLKYTHFFLRSFFKSALQELKVESHFFQFYPEQYLAFQSRLNADFFSGKESGDSHGLNQEQINAILVNETENLLVAGPGSGKTHVIMDRVGFYHIKRHVPEERILVLAFNKSAAGEVKSRIQEKYGLSKVEIRTFHSLGMKILRLDPSVQKSQIKVESNAERAIGMIISQNLKESPRFHTQYFSFFSHYLTKQNFDQYHDKNAKQLEHQEQEKYYTLEGELVKSLAECEIANFFITNNIQFEYEPLVTWCDPNDEGKTYHPDFYLTDYDIYLEHWAFQLGENPPDWFEDDENLYEQNRSWKCAQFEKHRKTLWHTYYEGWRDGSLEETLNNYCKDSNIEMEHLSQGQLMKKMGIGTKNHHLLTDMISSYIIAAKNCGFDSEKFDHKVQKSHNSSSSYDLAFFYLVIPIFEQYQEYLKSQSKIDFNDMINEAVLLLEQNNNNTATNKNTNKNISSALQSALGYDMIFVDEFQDISPQRFQLLQQIMQLNPKTRLFCVGDDWQAIYGFTGATNRYLTDYRRFFKDPALNFLVKNYRNTESILDYGSQIIRQTSDFIDKKFQPHHRGSQNDVKIHSISSTSEEWFQRDQYEKIYDKLLELIRDQAVDSSEIMILSRYTFGYTNLKIMCEERGEIPIALLKSGEVVKKGVRFYTLHKSKGLEADVVIILNVYEGDYGFPSQIDSKVNYKFLNPDLSEKADEEARLCFVGLTRARKQVFLYTWKSHESPFIIPPEIPKEPQVDQQKPNCLQEKFTAALLHETSKAYLFLMVDVDGKPKMWFPKSTVISIQAVGQTKIRNVQVQPWIVEQKNKELENNP
ncbi:MAG: UvrD-helicase domain-containing protein [Promethearchaeota archaeon]